MTWSLSIFLYFSDSNAAILTQYLEVTDVESQNVLYTLKEHDFQDAFKEAQELGTVQ
jgi:hypothetical protein